MDLAVQESDVAAAGIFIVSSPIWMRVVEGSSPVLNDWLEAAFRLIGAAIILSGSGIDN